MARRPGTRLAIAVAILAWHAVLVGIAWLPRQASRELQVPVMTWLRLEREPPVMPPPPAVRNVPAATVVRPEMAAPVAPAGDTAISVGPRVDFGAEARRAAREAVQGPSQRSLDTEPTPMVLPSPPAGPPRHKKGDEVPLGGGDFLLYVSERCYARIEGDVRAPGEVRPMAVHCDSAPPPIDAGALEKLRPKYLDLP